MALASSTRLQHFVVFENKTFWDIQASHEACDHRIRCNTDSIIDYTVFTQSFNECKRDGVDSDVDTLSPRSSGVTSESSMCWSSSAVAWADCTDSEGVSAP